MTRMIGCAMRTVEIVTSSSGRKTRRVQQRHVSRLWACGMMHVFVKYGERGRGVMGLGSVRNEDTCVSLARVAVMGVMNEKKEKLEGEAKRNELKQTL